jgi:DNA repair protein RadA/Sms
LAACDTADPRVGPSYTLMNAKTKTVFVCNQCGQEYGKWQGRCLSCGAWDSVTEMRIPKSDRRSRSAGTTAEAGIVELSTCDPLKVARIPSSYGDIDRVLGGGVVPGSVVLIGGDPGIGKSTLLLQMTARWAGQSMAVLYVSGEESAEQISLRASRLGVGKSPILFLPETSVERVCARLDEVKARVVVIDSIQTMEVEELQSVPGSVTQVRESAATLIRYAKRTGAALFFVGHVTKEGAIAGPRVMEHMVDTVLYFEGDENHQYRILRSVKNRFGPSGEIAVMSMTDRGLVEVGNASELFLLSGAEPQSGTAVVPVLEGSRVLVVELQALVNRTHFGIPQRVASGIDPKKLSLLVAVLERHGDIRLGDHDIFFNIAGGLKVAEPAIDLGIAAALVSSFRGKPIGQGTAFVGEIGLGGEIRQVNNMGARLKELVRLGFRRCVVPTPGKKSTWARDGHGAELVACKRIGDVAGVISAGS